VAQINDTACVMTLKSRAHVSPNHNHTVLTSQILRDQETANRALRIHGWVVAENQGSTLVFHEQFRESIRLKRSIATAGSVRFISDSVKNRRGTSWNIKILSNKKPHCRNLQGKMPP
jgi:hypothetical protein